MRSGIGARWKGVREGIHSEPKVAAVGTESVENIAVRGVAFEGGIRFEFVEFVGMMMMMMMRKVVDVVDDVLNLLKSSR